MRRALLFCAAVAVLLSGCANVPEKTESRREAIYAAHTEQVRALERWTLYARTAINTPEDSASASLYWDQAPERYSVTLRAPMGAGTVRIQGNANGVTLRSSDGTRARADDPGELLRRHTGYTLPVENLRYWLLGVAAPGETDSMALNANGRLQQLQQDGWTLRFDNYRKVDGFHLPGTIRAEGQDIELKLAAQQWDLSGGG